MKNLHKLLILLGMGVFLTSCYYDTYLEVEVPVPDEVSYSKDIQPLWNTDCVSCHGGAAPNLEAANSYNNLMNGYVVAGNAEASVLYQSLIWGDAKPMPPGQKWEAYKIQLVEAWIEQGAKNN